MEGGALRCGGSQHTQTVGGGGDTWAPGLACELTVSLTSRSGARLLGGSEVARSPQAVCVEVGGRLAAPMQAGRVGSARPWVQVLCVLGGNTKTHHKVALPTKGFQDPLRLHCGFHLFRNL